MNVASVDINIGILGKVNERLDGDPVYRLLLVCPSQTSIWTDTAAHERQAVKCLRSLMASVVCT